VQGECEKGGAALDRWEGNWDVGREERGGKRMEREQEKRKEGNPA
jgi:hypothetical protein